MTRDDQVGNFAGPTSEEALADWGLYLDQPIAAGPLANPGQYEQDAYTTAYDRGRRAGFAAARAAWN